jgi:pyruvate dehydrogenase E2 component (dihydrolipoamide acetyltransferase)
MATAVVMPRLGNTVESSIIVEWKKQPGDQIAEGEAICEIETDKATIDVESPVSGTILELFFEPGDEVEVQTNIAAIGEPGESADSLRPSGERAAAPVAAAPTPEPEAVEADPAAAVTAAETDGRPGFVAISPRARNLAQRKELDIAGIKGSGPGGRIIERDIQAALASRPRMTPLARSMVSSGDFAAPPSGSGVGGRITSRDLQSVSGQPAAAPPQPAPDADDEIQTTPLKGTRKIIAERMLASMQTTAQLTLNASADARALTAYRQQLKNSPEALELQKITINDLVLLAVARTLPHYPELNTLFTGDAIHQYQNVHLGFAVDTPRGLIVPVIRNAHRLSLKQIAGEARRLAEACLNGKVLPDELNGGTFTVTNLGSFGVESFTPILNPPQVGILGVGNINLKAIETEEGVEFIPHLGLSLTINHQVVDGAPAARFLRALCQNLAAFDLTLAL